jgi:DNA helicase HerA-like ATPase
MSQCSTLIAMRLSTERDQDVIRANANEGALDLLDFLPLLGDREAIVLGQGAIMPMRVRFRNLETGTISQSSCPSFSKAWQHSEINQAMLDDVVARWRMPARKGPAAAGQA